MEEYVRKCKRNVGISVMEVNHGDERMGIMETRSSGLSKRMKIDSENFEQLSSTMRLRNHGFRVNPPEKSLSPATSKNSDQFISSGDFGSSSSSSSDRVLASPSSRKECLRSVDLSEDFETGNPTFVSNKFSRETTPLSDFCRDTDEMESTATNRSKITAGKIPSPEEIEEFFSVAEEYEQKRFAEKYNFDVVKDVPLEGRYQWVRLKL